MVPTRGQLYLKAWLNWSNSTVNNFCKQQRPCTWAPSKWLKAFHDKYSYLMHPTHPPSTASFDVIFLWWIPDIVQKMKRKTREQNNFVNSPTSFGDFLRQASIDGSATSFDNIHQRFGDFLRRHPSTVRRLPSTTSTLFRKKEKMKEAIHTITKLVYTISDPKIFDMVNIFGISKVQLLVQL